MKILIVFKSIVILVIVSLLAACSQEPAQYTSSDVKLEKFNWKGKVPSSHRVKVINPYGNINSRTGSYKIVELTGVMQIIGPDSEKAEIDVSDENGTTVIEVKYPNGIYDNLGRKIARFDIGVFVPKGVVLELETDFGDIKLKKHKNRIIARTNSGKIAGSTKNIIHAFSNTGDIDLNLMPWQRSRFLNLIKKPSYFINSDKGNVAISLNANLDVDMNLSSMEPILSNHPMIQERVKVTQNQVAIHNEKASRRIEAKSKLGQLRVDLYEKPTKTLTNQTANTSSKTTFTNAAVGLTNQIRMLQ